MPVALEVLCGQTTTAGTVMTAWTMNTGNSLTIRSAPIESKVELLTAWSLMQEDGELRIVSPRLHDNVNNLRFAIEASGGWGCLIDPMFAERLYPQDVLVVNQTGSATGGDIDCGALLIRYENLSGVEARLFSPQQVKSRKRFLKTVSNVINSGIVGNYSGEQTLIADFSELKANTDYALLGYSILTTVPFCTVRIRGSFSGNLGIGMPAVTNDARWTAQFFVWLSERSGYPCIPVFNAADAANILVDVHGNEVDSNPTINFLLAELGT